jgi:hypothetical protein
MNPWSIFAEMETYLLACMVLYLNLLVLVAYGGLAGGRRGLAVGRGDARNDRGQGAAQMNRRPAAALMFVIGLAAVLALMAQLIWRLV